MEIDVNIKKVNGDVERVKYAPQKKYQKKSIKQVKIDLNLNTDADIIEFLETVENRQGYLKELIRKDMRK